MSGMAYCCDCGATFYREPSETWKIRCVACFVKRKNQQGQPQQNQPTDSYWSDRAAAAESKVAALEKQLAQQQSTIRILLNKPSQPASSFDKELAANWRALVQLVHPDKHAGSPGATRLTQWLNDIKPRLPCA